ncbi:hypothetical protein FIU88_18500 (plasmid) [Halomonas sp. THAF12]|uniref:JAB domain-containing protein n=1 Tax=Halomonas sp. THAF12 TaxID=2587849 RepID=UPI0012685D62|nr:DNA repair protein RadC [Halomonas sp. THAF12]QFT86943.1 hypothetical protein FIU88_18500 [Halomonas sp. THAF12]
MKRTNQMDLFAVSEPAEVYAFPGKGGGAPSQLKQEEDAVIEEALRIIEKRFYGKYQDFSVVFNHPHIALDYLTIRYATVPYEVFAVSWLDSQHRLIKHEVLFNGTLDSASIYPREIARRALEVNAGAVILTHNHPSGSIEPSDADRRITQRIQEALGLIDVRVLDHIIVAGTECTSFSDRGLM